MARVTWRKQSNETGLARVGQAPRGAILRVNGEDVGRVYPLRVGFSREWRGWYWTARSDEQGIPLKNTWDTPVKTIGDAKSACESYVRQCLADRADK